MSSTEKWILWIVAAAVALGGVWWLVTGSDGQTAPGIAPAEVLSVR
ncbi:MAG: hypothetical protein WDN10_00140 [bacterium]